MSTLDDLQKANARHQALTQDYNAAYAARWQPGDLTIPEFPPLVENPSIICALIWLLAQNAAIEGYILCIVKHEGDTQAAQDCIDAWYAYALTFVPANCVVAEQ